MRQQFLWGAATSAHQVEGHNVHNDWWHWEQKHPEVQNSGAAADHYHRFDEDFKLAKQLGHTAHRLSLEWSRLEVTPGEWSQKALAHYREVLTSLKEHGLTSFVTLHHFTNPQWVADAGGWLDAATPGRFERYAEFVARELGELVDFWVTINEPMVYATQSFWYGNWPPQEKSLRHMLRATSNLAAGHNRAYDAIHSVLPQAKVGIAKHFVAFLPENTWHLDDRLVVGAANWFFNRRFMNHTWRSHDFIGVNYYQTNTKHVTVFPPRVDEEPWEGLRSDMDWAIRPEGLTHVLLEAKRYGVPLYVTENGLADAADSRRADFIRSHLRASEDAQKGGADVRGYLHWSLLDNFEWAYGYGPRFGLVEVDYETQDRTPRRSAYVYKCIIEQAQGSL